ncbi:MAG: GGDEF domain-containing protein, partial [Casimicrobiaceae bacterium]
TFRVLSHYLAFWAVAAGAIAAFAGYEIAMSRQRAVEAAIDDLGATARLTAQHASLTLAYLEARTSMGAVGKGGRTDVVSGSSAAFTKVAQSITAQSTTAQSTTAQATTAQMANARRAEAPVVDASMADTVTTVVAEHDLPTAIGATIKPAQLLGLEGSLRFPARARSGLITAVEGAIVAQHAGRDAAPEEATIARALSAAAADSGRAQVVTNHTATHAVFVPVANAPLFAFAAIDEPDALADHAGYARRMLGFALAALVLLTIPIGLAGRRAMVEVHHRRRLEVRYEQERRRARSDPLTGVGNRAAFDAQLERCNRALAGEGTPFVLAIIDVDRFKALNDSQGHVVGDDALRRIARTLVASVRSTDVVTRLGGDEFAVLMPGASAEGSPRVCGKLHAALLAAAAMADLPIGFSIGVVAFEDMPAEPRVITALADRLMYDVKSAGGEGVRYGVYRGDGLHLSDSHGKDTACCVPT